MPQHEDHPEVDARRQLLAGIGSIVAGLGAIAGGVFVFGGDLETESCESVGGPKTGGGDPIAIERTIRDDDVEFLADEREVRYVEESAGGESESTTVDVAEWVTEKAGPLGVDRVREALRTGLGEDLAAVDVAAVPDASPSGTRIEVRLQIDDDAPGRSIDFSDLVAVTPERARVTVGLEEYTATREIPVVVTCRAPAGE